DPSGIPGVYPPDGSRGAYALCVPHILLARDTLPWERRAKSGVDAPWLALLLLNQTESAAHPIQTTTLAAYRKEVRLNLEPGQEDSDLVQVIDVPASLLHSALPTLEELPKLCHTRVVQNAKETVTNAVVVGKRLPSPGRNTAHLVSLENRYPDLQ